MGKRVCNAASVTDHIQSFIFGFKIFIDVYFHVIEFNFHTIKQGIIIGSTWSDFVKGIDNLNDSIQDSLSQPLSESNSQDRNTGSS